MNKYYNILDKGKIENIVKLRREMRYSTAKQIELIKEYVEKECKDKILNFTEFNHTQYENCEKFYDWNPNIASFPYLDYRIIALAIFDNELYYFDCKVEDYSKYANISNEELLEGDRWKTVSNITYNKLELLDEITEFVKLYIKVKEEEKNNG